MKDPRPFWIAYLRAICRGMDEAEAITAGHEAMRRCRALWLQHVA